MSTQQENLETTVFKYLSKRNLERASEIASALKLPEQEVLTMLRSSDKFESNQSAKWRVKGVKNARGVARPALAKFDPPEQDVAWVKIQAYLRKVGDAGIDAIVRNCSLPEQRATRIMQARPEIFYKGHARRWRLKEP